MKGVQGGERENIFITGYYVFIPCKKSLSEVHMCSKDCSRLDVDLHPPVYRHQVPGMFPVGVIGTIKPNIVSYYGIWYWLMEVCFGL